MLRRLAPEVQIGDGHQGYIIGPDHFAIPSGVDNECSSLTFNGRLDTAIPNIEKSLTLYLWKKLFPERYGTRQDETGWGELLMPEANDADYLRQVAEHRVRMQEHMRIRQLHEQFAYRLQFIADTTRVRAIDS